MRLYLMVLFVIFTGCGARVGDACSTKRCFLQTAGGCFVAEPVCCGSAPPSCPRTDEGLLTLVGAIDAGSCMTIGHQLCQ